MCLLLEDTVGIQQATPHHHYRNKTYDVSDTPSPPPPPPPPNIPPSKLGKSMSAPAPARAPEPKPKPGLLAFLGLLFLLLAGCVGRGCARALALFICL